MKLLLILAILITPILSLANGAFSGKWQGMGGDFTMYVNEVEQGKANCSHFDFDITQSAGRLSLNNIYAHCGANFEIQYNLISAEIKNNELYFENKKVGTINGNAFHLEITDGEKLKVVADFKVDSNTLDYSYTWTDGLTILVIHAKLTKSPDQVQMLSQALSQEKEVYCQFWNSVDHTPEGMTILSNGENYVDKAVSRNQFGLTLSFSGQTKFAANLVRYDAQGHETILKSYSVDLTKDKLENFIITASTDDGVYTSALCSPQNN